VTIGQLTLEPATIAWLPIAFYTWRLRMRGHGWLTVVPVMTLHLLGWVIAKPFSLSLVLFYVSLGLIVWLLHFNDPRNGPKKKRRLASKPVERRAPDWSGAAIPAT